MGRKPKPLQPVKLEVSYVYVDVKELEPAIRILARMLDAVAKEMSREKTATPVSPPEGPIRTSNAVRLLK